MLGVRGPLIFLGECFHAKKIHRTPRPFGKIVEGKEPSRFLDKGGIPKGRSLATEEELKQMGGRRKKD